MQIAGGFIFIVFLFGFIIYDSFRQTYHLNLYTRYTIGKPVNIERSGHLVKKMVYKFRVSGKVYERKENFQGGVIGKLYFVKFSIKEPRYSDFLQNNPVPDSIKSAPPDGWEELPVK
jgi:hypothetical protein